MPGSSRINSQVEALFPRLRTAGFEVLSPTDPRYNCIAWAAGDDRHWWEPIPPSLRLGGYYWPTEVSWPITLDTYVIAFESLGYKRCDDGTLQAGYDKVAIYAQADGSPTHAARQLADGRWVSKLGQFVDISHTAVDGVSGTNYGEVAVFMRRTASDP